MTTIRFNPNAQRFINEKGNFISEEFVLKTLESFRVQNLVEIQKLLSQVSENSDLESVYKKVSSVIRDAWTVEFIVGKGGLKQIKNSDIKLLNSKLKDELTLGFSNEGSSYGLQEVFNQFEQSEISQAQFISRVQAYGKGSRRAYFLGQDQRQTQPYMQRFLHGTNNCQSCISYANAGMVKNGSLPLPGDACECRSNCNCTVKYSSEKQYKAWIKSQINSFSGAVVTP